MARKQKGKALYEADGYKLGRRGDAYVADGRASGGKRHTLGEFPSEAAAIEALHKFVEARKALLRQQAEYTIGDLWEMWLRHREADGFSNDIYEANWASLGPYFGHRSPSLLTEDDCRAYARARFALGRAPATVNTELVRLRACLAWAAERRHIPFAPIVWAPSRGKPRTRILTAEEARNLLIAAHDELHIYVFTVLAIATGARHMAILDLEWNRVDFATGIIDYEVDVEFNPMQKSWKKGRAQVVMGALVREALQRAYAARQTDHVVEYRGKRLKSIRESFGLSVVRAGLGTAIPRPTKTQPNRVRVITDVTPHVLRHSVNSWLQEGGIDAERRAYMLGQRDVRTNQLVYSHGRPDRMLTHVVSVIDAELARPATSNTPSEGPRGAPTPPQDGGSCPLVTNATG